MTLQERCREIWKEEFNIEDKKIEWLISCLTPEAIEMNDSITDEQIRSAKGHLLWYGLGEALLNYCSWEVNQY